MSSARLDHEPPARQQQLQMRCVTIQTASDEAADGRRRDNRDGEFSRRRIVLLGQVLELERLLKSRFCRLHGDKDGQLPP
jgi:hypothetical protein